MKFFTLRNKVFLCVLYCLYAVMVVTAQSNAAVTGIVFEDSNGNGQQDNDEVGIANVVIVAIEENTGAPITATTDADGAYRLEFETINHIVRIDESSLPFNGELTTARLQYNLNVPPGFVAPNINFGYQEVEPANVYGLVFEDSNGNGVRDEGESGLAGVTLLATHDETGAITSITTDSNGEYNFQAVGAINHQLKVDTLTLPFTGQLTTGRESYNLNIPPGYFTPNINYGYQEVEPARAFGVVFEDVNGNGEQDEGESGLAGVTLLATHDETGTITTITTDANGEYTFESNGAINHQLKVDTLTLPFSGQLTTARESYNLNVPPAYFAVSVNFGYQEVEPARAYGVVFEDVNGNGEQDEGESGLAGVTLLATHDETGTITTITTDANGEYTFESNGAINHQLKVDTLTLPFTGQLTTGRETYSLNVPPDYFAVSVNFGYQEAEPSVVSGFVFEDLNDNGQQDDGEKGLPNVQLIITHQSDGVTNTISTDSDGLYRYETMVQRFNLAVDEESLPFADPILTTGRDSYTLNIPNGFIAPNVNFGYRAATSDDYPPLQSAGSSPSLDNSTDDIGADSADDGLTNPFDDPVEDLPIPEELPEDAGNYALPLEGTWTVYHGSLSFNCGGMSFDQPPLAPETVTLWLEDGGRTLRGEGFEGGTNTLTASDEYRGLYTGTISITQDGATVTLDFFIQVVVPDRLVGYLTGQVNAQGVSCSAYRPFEAEYSGG